MDRRVLKTIEFLEFEGFRRFRVGELAQRVGLRASRLEHLFKHHTKLSIRNFVKRRRILHAAELIATTDERIAQICYAAGFTDPSNFNHAFKEHFGVSPREYRNARRFGLQAEPTFAEPTNQLQDGPTNSHGAHAAPPTD